MKEIVFIRRATPALGGIQGQISRLAGELYKRKVFQPVLVCENTHCGMAELFLKQGFEVLTADMKFKNILSSSAKIAEILKNRDVALIQSHLFYESMFARLVRKKISKTRPEIKHILRAQTYINGSPKSAYKRFLQHTADKLTSRWVDMYLTNGKYMADEIVASGISADKVKVLINGRSLLGSADEKCSQPDKPLPAKIAMIAVFRKVKGHDCLIKALAVLKQKKINITVRLIGSDLDGEALEKQIKQTAAENGVLDMLEFYGNTTDVYSAVKDIPVIVLPANSSEGVPNCILEAMSLRKLVVAAEMNGVAELITDKAEGFLHQPKDYKTFADILEHIFTTPAGQFEQIRDRALKKWQDNFTLDRMLENLIGYYKQLDLIN